MASKSASKACLIVMSAIRSMLVLRQAVGEVVVVAFFGNMDVHGQCGASRLVEGAHCDGDRVLFHRIPEQERTADRAKPPLHFSRRVEPRDLVLRPGLPGRLGNMSMSQKCPDCLRHCRQWHASGGCRSPAISKLTAPQRQDPLCMRAFLPLIARSIVTAHGIRVHRPVFSKTNLLLSIGAALPHFTRYGLPDMLLLDAASSMKDSADVTRSCLSR